MTEGIEKVIPGLLWLSINVVKLMSRPVKIQIGSRNRLRDTLNHQLVAGKLVITSLDRLPSNQLVVNIYCQGGVLNLSVHTKVRYYSLT